MPLDFRSSEKTNDSTGLNIIKVDDSENNMINVIKLIERNKILIS